MALGSLEFNIHFRTPTSRIGTQVKHIISLTGLDLPVSATVLTHLQRQQSKFLTFSCQEGEDGSNGEMDRDTEQREE